VTDTGRSRQSPAGPCPPPATRASRRPGGLLWHRGFRLLWTGETVSQLGNAMAVVAMPLLAVVTLHASAFAVSALTAAAYLPWLLIGLLAGTWADQVDTRRLMVTCDLAAAVLYASLPVTARLGVLTVPQVLGVALLAGSANVIFTTAYQVFLPALVRPADLMEGNAKLQASLSACAVAGPGLAGLAAGTAGASAALLANAVSFLVSAGCLLSIPPAGLRQPQRRPARRPVRVTVAEGVRYVAGDSGLRLLTIWAAAQNLFLAGFTALAVVYLVRSAGFKPATAGLLLAVGGIGGVLGALAARRLAGRYGSAGALRVTAFAGMPFTLLIPLAARGWHILFFLAGFPVASGALAAGAVILGSFRQAACPPELLGRVVAAMRFLAYGANPFGALLAGSLASWLGLRAALWITLTGWVATGAFLLAPVLRNRELPAPPANTKTDRAEPA
jgi:predicted MFS family arabinose efflux permease